jgi:hypothetical protein
MTHDSNFLSEEELDLQLISVEVRSARFVGPVSHFWETLLLSARRAKEAV